LLLGPMDLGESKQVEAVKDFDQLAAGGGQHVAYFADAAADGKRHSIGAFTVAIGEHRGGLFVRVQSGQSFVES